MRAIVGFFFTIFVFVQSAFADDNSPLFYTREKITITRNGLTLDPSLLPWQKQQAIEDTKISFDVDIRDGRTLYRQEGWFNLTGYDENSGVLMVFAQDARAPIVYSAQYAPVDILFIDRQGTITQILPSIELAKLEEEIIPETPVRAFLFIKSGTCEKLTITPGDTVENKLFKKPPTILRAPVKSTPTTPPQPDAFDAVPNVVITKPAQ